MATDNQPKNSNELIKFLVGTERISVLRSTLCSELSKGTLFETMFSESSRWADDGLFRLDDGTIFIDHDPEFFSAIISYLRTSGYIKRSKDPEWNLALMREFKYWGFAVEDSKGAIREPDDNIHTTGSCRTWGKHRVHLSTPVFKPALLAKVLDAIGAMVEENTWPENRINNPSFTALSRELTKRLPDEFAWVVDARNDENVPHCSWNSDDFDVFVLTLRPFAETSAMTKKVPVSFTIVGFQAF